MSGSLVTCAYSVTRKCSGSKKCTTATGYILICLCCDSKDLRYKRRTIMFLYQAALRCPVCSVIQRVTTWPCTRLIALAFCIKTRLERTFGVVVVVVVGGSGPSALPPLAFVWCQCCDLVLLRHFSSVQHVSLWYST